MEQGHNEVGFQSLPRPVGFTLDLLYESGSPTPLKGCVVRLRSSSSPPSLHSAFSRSFRRTLYGYSQPHREEVGLTD